MNKTYLTPAEINALLESTRNQKFRNISESRLEANAAQSDFMRKLRKDKTFQENLAQAHAVRSPEHHANQQAAMKQAMETGNWRERQLAGARRNAQNPEWLEKTRARNRKQAQDPEWRKRRQEGMDRVKNDPVIKRKHLIANGTKPVRVPWGIFAGPVPASEHPDATVKYDTIRRKLKQGHAGFDYITWAEYDEIQGITGLPQ